MSNTEKLLSSIIDEREKDIKHLRALLKLTQDDVMRLRGAGEELVLAWLIVCTDNEQTLVWADAVAKWDTAKEDKQS